MSVKRTQYAANQKAKIALEAIKGNHTIAQLISNHGVHATQIHTWKKQLLASLPNAFSGKQKKSK